VSQTIFDFAQPETILECAGELSQYQGLLFIGDPHIEARTPGFRRDDYPATVLEKLRWCLETASNENLLPVLLGDLFQLPRDNPNWLIVELLELFNRDSTPQIVGIYGNHDVHENQIDENDSLSILAEAGRIRLLDEQNVFRFKTGDQVVVVGGTPWGQPLPTQETVDALKKNITIEPSTKQLAPLVVWITHHDLCLPGYDSGSVKISDDLGIDVVVNGHVHRRLDEHYTGQTTWINPGNITRRKRSDATKAHVPSVLKMLIEGSKWTTQYQKVPHQPFDQVFYDAVIQSESETQGSDFVAGLAELKARRTQSGAGLSQFLELNLKQFNDDVAMEIQNLASEVLEGTQS